jgi:spore coat polysaccharide biosynthesis protein SpsF
MLRIGGRVVAIIQARVGSTRLPGKVLLPLGGDTVLGNVIARVKAAKSIDAVVVATSNSVADSAVAVEAARLGVDVYRGSEQDVLARYVGAARASDAEVVVRITSDCPLLDPWVVDEVVRRFLSDECDYASNTINRSFPRGLDVEVVAREALELAASEATRADEREHVTLFFHHHSSRFRLAAVSRPEATVRDHDLSAQRWTLDTPEDLRFLERVFGDCGIGVAHIPPFAEVAAFVAAHPDISAINANVQQKPTTGAG